MRIPVPFMIPYVNMPTINVNNRPTFNSKVKKVLKLPSKQYNSV